MTLAAGRGGSPALCDREHPSPSGVTTTRVQRSVREAAEQVAEAGEEGRSGRSRRMGTAAPLLHHHFTGLGVRDSSLSQWESLLLREWMGRRVGCYRRAECNQFGGLDFVDYGVTTKASRRVERLIGKHHLKGTLLEC